MFKCDYCKAPLHKQWVELEVTLRCDNDDGYAVTHKYQCCLNDICAKALVDNVTQEKD